MPQPLTMYTTTWCAYCRRLKSQLAAEGIEMAEVNIEEDPAAADFVMSVNGGNQTVPTVVFPDGSTRMAAPAATEPLAIEPEKPRKSRFGRFTHCTGNRNGLR